MPVDEEQKEAIPVETITGEEEEKKKTTKNKGKVPVDEISEEDKILKEGLDLAVQRLQEVDNALHQQALDHLVNEIRSSTSSMTSVPKPLKFLRLHYDTLKNLYTSWDDNYPLKKQFADVLSVLAMTMSIPGSRESLKYKLQGTLTNISSWGHEYVRSLSGEISEEYNKRSLEAPSEDDVDVDDLIQLVDDIIPFQMQHNAEAEAVDLLMEVQRLHKLIDTNIIDNRNYERVCLYLLRCADFMADPDDLSTLFHTAYTIYKTQSKYTDALRVAIKLRDYEKITELFSIELGASDIDKKQMAFILARHRSSYTHLSDEALNDLIGNVTLSDRYLAVALSMDVLEPKTPEMIYKTHLAEGTAVAPTRSNLRGGANSAVDSARNNLASSYVNGFVNAGYGSDKLVTADGGSWVFKNKDQGMTAAAASVGKTSYDEVCIICYMH